MAAVIFASCVCILAIGFVWFWIARPILEDCGVIRVNDYPDSDAHVMSRSERGVSPSLPSSLETDAVQTPDQTEDPAARRQKLFDTYKPLRKAGMNRDDARALLKPWGIPLDNNVWAEVGAAMEREAAQHVTPIVGRPTNARFETDADYPYQAPAH